MRNNSRNKRGVKDSSDRYLTVKGQLYEQYSDGMTKDECQKLFPEEHFISRTIDKSFVRVYIKVNKKGK